MSTWMEMLQENKKAEISFDWQDDYSEWRITDDEDIVEPVEKAVKLLARNNVTVGTVRTYDELETLQKAVRNLKVNDENVNDADYREADKLTPKLEISYDLRSIDAEQEFECCLEAVEELLTEWDEAHPLKFATPDGCITTASDEWAVLKAQRNGLGDRWSVSATDEAVHLPYGREAKALKATKKQQEFIEALWDFWHVEDTELEIAETALDIEEGLLTDVSEIVDKFTDPAIEFSISVQLLKDCVTLVEAGKKATAEAVEFVRTLRKEWHGTPAELVQAAIQFHKDPVAA